MKSDKMILLWDMEVMGILIRCMKNQNRRIEKIRKEEIKDIKKQLRHMVKEGHQKELYRPCLLYSEYKEKSIILDSIIEYMANKYRWASFRRKRCNNYRSA